MLAYLLIRLSGVDREVMEKWLYVIVGLTFISGHPRHRAPLLLDRRAALLAADRRLLLARWSRSRSSRWRPTRTGDPPVRAVPSEHAGAPLDDRERVFSALGAGMLGLAHTWPSVNKWTHGTLITPMHGHGVLRRLRDDRARHDHLCAAGAHRHAESRAPDAGRAAGRSGCRSAACSA